MPDEPRRRLTIADIGKPFRIGERPVTAPAKAALRPAAPQLPAKVAEPPQPAPAPTPAPVALPVAAEPVAPCAPGGKTPAQIAKRRRWQQKRDAARLPEALAMLATLAERYPAVFGGNCLPLKIGCHLEIQADVGCDARVLSAALHRWCSRDAYLRATAEGTHRVALDGTPVVELSADDRANAAARLAAARAAIKRAKPRRAEPAP